MSRGATSLTTSRPSLALRHAHPRRAVSSLAPPVRFPKGEIPLTGKVPGSAGQVAQLVLFLASDAADHITGTEVYIDGAQSLLQG